MAAALPPTPPRCGEGSQPPRAGIPPLGGRGGLDRDGVSDAGVWSGRGVFVVGLPLGALNTALSPLLMHIIPHEIMGRVLSVFTTSQTLCNLISVSLAGLLGTLLAGFHAGLLGIPFGAYDTIYIGTGVLFLLAAFYAMINLRGLRLNE